MKQPGEILFKGFFATLVAFHAGALPAGELPREATREVPGFPEQPYDIHVPPGTDGQVEPLPVIFVFHGAPSNSALVARQTCGGGDPDDEHCLNRVAANKGFVVVYPNGTPTPGNPESRSWHVGGGTGRYKCVAGYACTQGIDHSPYWYALFADVESYVGIDRQRVFAAGFSSGAAMSHRLACTSSRGEFPVPVRAVAAVAGANQFDALGDCSPAGPVPVLQIHGTADLFWTFEQGSGILDGEMIKVGVPDTMTRWAKWNGCAFPPEREALDDDDPEDGTQVFRWTYPSCDAGATTVLFGIVRGGHTWPKGWQYLPAAGEVSQDVSGSELVVEFFRAHGGP